MKPRRGRAPQRRNEKARLAVLHAADDLLAERGYRALTIEGIAARAGVSKQTIYRWWPSKVEILLDVLIDDSEAIAVPETAANVADLRRHMQSLSRFLNKDPAGKVLLALLGEAQQDPAVAEAFDRRWKKSQREAERGMIRRGIESGQFDPGLDIDTTLDFLYGPIYYRAMSGKPVTRPFVDALLARVIPG